MFSMQQVYVFNIWHIQNGMTTKRNSSLVNILCDFRVEVNLNEMKKKMYSRFREKNSNMTWFSKWTTNCILWCRTLFWIMTLEPPEKNRCSYLFFFSHSRYYVFTKHSWFVQTTAYDVTQTLRRYATTPLPKYRKKAKVKIAYASLFMHVCLWKKPYKIKS